MDPPLEPAAAPNTCQHTLRTRRGDYLIQASWPPAWGEDRKSPSDRPVPIVYLVDGNAYFFSAAELVRRIRHLPNSAADALVVAVGYPTSRSALHPRRTADLTPPSPAYAPVLGRDGKPLVDNEHHHGGAAQFLDAIEHDVMPFVAATVFPDVRIGPHALWGHSYGGLLALYTLFSRPRLFDTVVAASPSIWWNDRRIVQLEREYRRGKQREVEEEDSSPAPQLFVMYGSDEQFPKRFHHESEEDFALRKKLAAERRMKDNAIEMGSRLRDSGLLRKVWLQEFQDEDHGSAALCALSRGITGFLEACSF